MTSLLERRRGLTLWTDLLRERYYEALTENCENRLRALRGRPTTAPGDVLAEAIAREGAWRELCNARQKLQTEWKEY